MKHKVILAAALALLFCGGVQAQKRPWLNKSLPISDRVNALLDQMTVEEMIGETVLHSYSVEKDSDFRALVSKNKVGAVLKANGVIQIKSLQDYALAHSRLGIPLMFHEDVIHGYRTVAPIPLAQACSWDTAMVRRTAAVAAREAAASGLSLTYAPMLDVCVDPRWGRVTETSGEDPFLSSAMGEALVKGFQGSSLSLANTVMACSKHFVGYASVTAGHDYLGEEFSQRQLFERYLPSHDAAIRAGVGSVMCSYTMYNGQPVTFSKYIGKDLLRDTLGFKGLYMTDWTTCSNALRQGASPNKRFSATKSLEAGIDMDMASNAYRDNLLALYKEGKVSLGQIRNAAYRCLEAKFKVGLFDNPYLYLDPKREKREILSEQNKQETLEMTVESMLLLKNDNSVLPLADGGTIAVVGPFAEEKDALLGVWRAKGKPEDVTSMAEGMSKVFGKGRVKIASCDYKALTDSVETVVNTAKSADAVIVCIGQNSKNIGEANCVSTLEIEKGQIDMLRRIKALGKTTIVVMFGGRPLITKDVLPECDALLYAWHPGVMGGEAAALLLKGERVPSAKTCQTFPRTVGQVPIYYNTYRPMNYIEYTDVEKGPQFPFGFGLSYNTYEYSDLKLNTGKVKTTDNITVSVKVKNTGKYEGREIVQLYVKHIYDASTVIPKEKELQAFRSIVLKPGEEQEVKFTLTPEAFKVLTENMQWKTEPGLYEVQVGRNSADVMTQRLTLE